MQPGVSVGEPVALHLFEPRYKLLARRAWATDQTFVYCARPPMSTAGETSFNLPYGAEPLSDSCVAVVIDKISFGPDGEADVWGRATEPVSIDQVLLEPQTGGLFSTTTPIGGGDGGAAAATLLPRVAGAQAKLASHDAPLAALAAVPDREGGYKGGSSPYRLHRGMYGIHTSSLLTAFVASALVGLCLASCCCAKPRKPRMRFCPPPPQAPKVVVVAAVPGFLDTAVAVPTAMPA